jgi:hypothetical protein
MNRWHIAPTDSLLRLRGKGTLEARQNVSLVLVNNRNIPSPAQRGRARPTRRSRSDPGREVGLRRASRKRPISLVTCPRVRVGVHVVGVIQ